MLKMADTMNISIAIMEKQYQALPGADPAHAGLGGQIAGATETTRELRDNIADFDDQFRPIRNYFYWEPHCFDIPMCAALRSVFDSLDGIDKVTDQTGAVQANTDQLANLAPQLTALLPQTIASMKTSRDLTLASYNISEGAARPDWRPCNDTALAMGQSFDQAKNDDLFYLPPEAFDNPDFKRGLDMFLRRTASPPACSSPTRAIPTTPEGIARVDAERNGRAGGLEDVLALGRQGLPRWGRGDLQGHVRRRQLRPDDRGGVVADADLHDHADPDPKCGGGTGHRRHRGQFDRRVLRSLGADLAGPVRHPGALARHADVGHHPVGRRIRLQPAAGLAVQGRDPRRT